MAERNWRFQPQWPGMKPLSRLDSLHLLAAEGWLGLGNATEANTELERFSARRRCPPEVLSLRWRIYAVANNWDAALDIAIAVTNLAPEDANGWVQRACS